MNSFTRTGDEAKLIYKTMMTSVTLKLVDTFFTRMKKHNDEGKSMFYNHVSEQSCEIIMTKLKMLGYECYCKIINGRNEMTSNVQITVYFDKIEDTHRYYRDEGGKIMERETRKEVSSSESSEDDSDTYNRLNQSNKRSRRYKHHKKNNRR